MGAPRGLRGPPTVLAVWMVSAALPALATNMTPVAVTRFR